jgi:hypothetical protein
LRTPAFPEARRAAPSVVAAADHRAIRVIGKIEDEVGTAQHRGRNRRLRKQAREPRALGRDAGLQAAKLEPCGDARQQLARAEGLDEVVVGTSLHPLDARLLARPRR